MYKVSELQNIELSNEGADCSVKGRFYYRISEDSEKKSDFVNCYIADSSDSSAPRLFLSDELGEAIIDDDETFGMMVGGDFAYYDIDVELKCVIKKVAQVLICEDVVALKLAKDGESQLFSF